MFSEIIKIKYSPHVLIIFLLCILHSIVNAENCRSDEQIESQCCEFFKSMNNTKATRIQTFDKTVCTMSVYHRDSSASFRRFGFASDGQVSVFMQPGGNKQKTNSSQSFLIFPFGEIPSVKYNSDERLKVNSGSGQSWSFNTQSGLPVALEACDIKISSKFSLQDSGFKINSCKRHLIIETPVEVGGEYIAYPDKTLIVKDPEGKNCKIKNSDLYSYRTTGKSYKDKLGRHFDFKLRYRSNYEMGQNLKKICPELNVSMLLNTKISNSSKEESRARDILEGRSAK